MDRERMRKHYRSTFKAHLVQEVLRGEKTIAQIASDNSVHPSLIGLWKSTALERFPSVFEKDNADRIAERLAHEKQLRELYEEIGRLTTQVTFLKKNLACAMSRHERIALVERGGDLPLTVESELVSVSRSSVYYCPVAPSEEEIKLKMRIRRRSTTRSTACRWR